MSKYASKITDRLINDLPVKKLGFLDSDDIVLRSENDELARALISSSSSEISRSQDEEIGLFRKCDIPKIQRAIEHKTPVLIDREIENTVQILTNKNKRPKVLSRTNDEIQNQKEILKQKLNKRKEMWNTIGQERREEEIIVDFQSVIEGMKQILVEKERVDIEEMNRIQINLIQEKKKQEEQEKTRRDKEKEQLDREKVLKEKDEEILKDDTRSVIHNNPRQNQSFDYDMTDAPANPTVSAPQPVPFQFTARGSISLRTTTTVRSFPSTFQSTNSLASLSMELEPVPEVLNIQHKPTQIQESDSMRIHSTSSYTAPNIFSASALNPQSPVISTYSLPSSNQSVQAVFSLEELKSKVSHSQHIKENLLKSTDNLLIDNRKELSGYIFSLSISCHEFDDKFISRIMITLAKGGENYSNKSRILFVNCLIDYYLESQFGIEIGLNMCDTLVNLIQVLSNDYPDIHEIFLVEILSRHNIMLPACARNETEARNRNNLADLGFLQNVDIKHAFMKSIHKIKCLGMLLGVYFKSQKMPYSLQHAWIWVKRLSEIPVNLIDRNYVPALIGMLRGCGQDMLNSYKKEFVDLMMYVRNEVFPQFGNRAGKPEYYSLMNEVCEILRKLDS